MALHLVAGGAACVLYSGSVRRKTHSRRLWLAAGFLLAFMLLAGSLQRFTLAPGLRVEPTTADTINHAFSVQERAPNPLGGQFVGRIVSAVVALAVILFIVGLWRKESRLSTLMAVVVGAAMTVLLAGIVRGPEIQQPPITGEGLAGDPDAEAGVLLTLDPEDAVSAEPVPESSSWAWSVAVVVPALIGLFFVLRPYFGRAEGAAGSDLEQLVTEAADQLEAGDALHDVVQRCYREMEQDLERARSARRRESMTPREFESELARRGVDVTDIRALTRLFERSRYARRAAREDEQQRAIEHLRRIAQSLGSTP